MMGGDKTGQRMVHGRLHLWAGLPVRAFAQPALAVSPSLQSSLRAASTLTLRLPTGGKYFSRWVCACLVAPHGAVAISLLLRSHSQAISSRLVGLSAISTLLGTEWAPKHFHTEGGHR